MKVTFAISNPPYIQSNVIDVPIPPKRFRTKPWITRSDIIVYDGELFKLR